MPTEIESIREEFRNGLNSMRAEFNYKFEELKKGGNEKVTLAPEVKRIRALTDAVDEVMVHSTGKTLHTNEVIDILIASGDDFIMKSGKTWVPRRRKVSEAPASEKASTQKSQEESKNQWDGGAVGTHLYDNCVIPDQNAPEKATTKRFVKKGSGSYTANTFFKHPTAQKELPLRAVK